jgi:hypothetical protein
MGGATMRQRVLNAVAAIVMAMPAVMTVGAGPAGAEGATFLVFTQIFRRCDFSNTRYVGPTGYARPTALVRHTGSEVVADVQIATAIPNTPYNVGLVQMPRSSATGCNPGDAGVIGGVIFTDPTGAGSVTLGGPVASGATGAWMYISRPGEYSQTPAEFYTSDFVVPL